MLPGGAGASSTPERCDVLVLGGGPAGLATAIELRRNGALGVVVAEAREQPSERYGESLPPDIVIALDRLGVANAFRADGHLPCPGSVSVWGSDRPGYNDFILNPFGHGWHISRARFEAMLRARAIELGTVLQTGVRAVAAAPSDTGFAATLQGEDGRRSVVHASRVVDATGWRSWFARRQGAVRSDGGSERLVAIVRFATDRAGAFTAQTVVEATPDGWWYGARVPGDQVITVFVTAPEAARALLQRNHAGWRDRLARTQLIEPRLANCDLVDERFRGYPVRSGILDRLRGDRWFAVGDAASAYDPIVSRGIHTALADARDAAAAILSETGRAIAPALPYEERVHARFQSYLADRAQLYAQEQRWDDRPFWRARAEAARPARGAPVAYTSSRT